MKVFVYGTLKKGRSNSSLLRNTKYLGESEKKGFYMVSLGGFPTVVHGTEEDSVYGEVYEITPEIFTSLDRLEGYPDLFNREEIPTEYGQAIIYFLTSSRETMYYPKVEGGKW